MRGSNARLNAVTLRAASWDTASRSADGWNTATSATPSRHSAISSLEGGCTLRTTSLCPKTSAAVATAVATAAEVFGQSDVVLKVQPPSSEEIALCREGVALVAVFQPSAEREAVSQLAARKVTAFSLALLPRITRAQAMD